MSWQAAGIGGEPQAGRLAAGYLTEADTSTVNGNEANRLRRKADAMATAGGLVMYASTWGDVHATSSLGPQA